jgi:hypothetical protein
VFGGQWASSSVAMIKERTAYFSATGCGRNVSAASLGCLHVMGFSRCFVSALQLFRGVGSTTRTFGHASNYVWGETEFGTRGEMQGGGLGFGDSLPAL